MRGKTCGLVGWTWKNKPIRRKTNKPQASRGTRTVHMHTQPRMGLRDTLPWLTQSLRHLRNPHRGKLRMSGHLGARLHARSVVSVMCVRAFAYTLPLTCSHSVQLTCVDTLGIWGIFPHPQFEKYTQA